MRLMLPVMTTLVLALSGCFSGGVGVSTPQNSINSGGGIPDGQFSAPPPIVCPSDATTAEAEVTKAFQASDAVTEAIEKKCAAPELSGAPTVTLLESDTDVESARTYLVSQAVSCEGLTTQVEATVSLTESVQQSGPCFSSTFTVAAPQVVESNSDFLVSKW